MSTAAAGPAVQLRPAVATDLPLVFSSWLRSYRDGPIGRVLTDTVFYSEAKPVVVALASSARLIVACDPANPDTIYGWACGERLADLVVHFVYVRSAWRGWGIARRLLEALGYEAPEPIVATHVTALYSSPRFRRSGLRVVNNPWLGIRRAAGVMHVHS